jgi:argininosuccinate lyase
MAALSRSVQFDWRLAPYDLLQTRAHVSVLHAAGLLTDAELAQTHAVLASMYAEVEAGTLLPADDDEDVHTTIERTAIERLGPLGGKLRAGRSRNDQVATDFRLYVRDAAREVAAAVTTLAEALLDQAEAHAASPAPGYTHLQRAQPVTLGHELAKHAQALARDIARLRDSDARTSVSPLGAGALAGSPIPHDAVAVAATLGFDAAADNSLDAVSDRDFAAEFLFDVALIGVHASKLGEEIVLWSSKEFGFARLDDAWSTGSSIMPQKKNPDVAELARGKSGRLIGDLASLLIAMKGLPFAYNRDLQEDKEPVFDAVDTLLVLLPALAGTVATLTFDVDKLRATAPAGHALATEIADWLVRKGVPFRDAHEVAGECVRVADARGVDVHELSVDELIAVSPLLDAGVLDVLTVDGALAARVGRSGTAPVRVNEQIVRARTVLQSDREWASTSPIPIPW